MPSIEERLAALEAILGTGVSDVGELQPNYLTQNTDGTVGASFTGQVNALGLILPEGALNNFQSEVQWQDPGTNATEETIQGVNNAGVHALVQGAKGDAISAAAYQILLGWPSAAGACIELVTPAGTKILLDKLGQSDYVQNPRGTTKLAVNGGISGPFTVAANTSFNVPHGLGRQPIAFAGVCYGLNGTMYGSAAVLDAVNIGWACTVAMANNFFAWVALG